MRTSHTHLRAAGAVFALFLLPCALTCQIVGRYTDGKDYAVYFERTRYGITMRPVLWTSTQLLREVDKDHFVVVDRTSRTADLIRDAGGRVIGVRVRGMAGEGLDLRRADGPPLPIEDLLSGRVRNAVGGFLSDRENGKRRLLQAADSVRRRLPTRTSAVVAFLRSAAAQFESDAAYHEQLGLALVQAGDRNAARASLKRAYDLDHNRQETVAALARMGLPLAAAKDGGWKLPFSLDAVFAKPTAAELRAVEADWASRDLRPSEVRTEYEGDITVRDWPARVRIISHLVHGSRHYGAILIPQNAAPGCCPVIIDAKGVSPTYFPLDLERIESPAFMDHLANRFIYVVPSFRGEVMNFRDRKFTSEGDRRDALDGATDDAIALLNVALETTPEADPTRICAFGRSRGGTVAMLAGIRDPRIDCVVNIAGPTDWFYLMGTEGWTEEELWADALRNRANPTEPGGQNVERFLQKAIEGRAGLQDVRRNMIASSPLYFARRMPASLHHYGLEDPSVPVRNGYALRDAVRKSPRTARRFTAHFYPGQGHDTDRLAAPVLSRGFIADALGVTAAARERGKEALTSARIGTNGKSIADRGIRQRPAGLVH